MPHFFCLKSICSKVSNPSSNLRNASNEQLSTICSFNRPTANVFYENIDLADILRYLEFNVVQTSRL